ncbi:hypothetical protein ACW0JT_02100 [Arthrobacter sp. SA17]
MVVGPHRAFLRSFARWQNRGGQNRQPQGIRHFFPADGGSNSGGASTQRIFQLSAGSGELREGTSATTSVSRSTTSVPAPSCSRSPAVRSRGMVTTLSSSGMAQSAMDAFCRRAASSAWPDNRSSNSSVRRRSTAPARSDCSNANASALTADSSSM